MCLQMVAKPPDIMRQRAAEEELRGRESYRPMSTPASMPVGEREVLGLRDRLSDASVWIWQIMQWQKSA